MGRDRDRDRECTRAEKKDVQNEREGRKYAKKKRRRRRSEERERQWRRFLLIPSKAKPSPTTSRPSAEARRGLFFDHGTGVCSGNGVSHCTRSYSRCSALFFRGRRTRARRSCSTAAASWNWCS